MVLEHYRHAPRRLLPDEEPAHSQSDPLPGRDQPHTAHHCQAPNRLSDLRESGGQLQAGGQAHVHPRVRQLTHLLGKDPGKNRPAGEGGRGGQGDVQPDRGVQGVLIYGLRDEDFVFL